MARSAAALAACLVLCALPARAEAQSRELAEAREAYAAGDYARVRTLLEPYLGGATDSIDDPFVERDARRYLGATYVLLGASADGEIQFRELMNDLPLAELRGQDLNSSVFVEEVLVVFRRVRDALIEEAERRLRDRDAAMADREARRHAALLRLIDIAEDNELEIENDPIPSWVPFGIGQFTNGNEDLGWFFLLSESAFLLAGMGLTAAYFALDAHNDSVGTPGSEGRTRFPESTMYAVASLSYASIGTFVILGVAGIIEARISFVPRRRHRIDREIPREVLEDLELAAGPGGVTLRGRFW